MAFAGLAREYLLLFFHLLEDEAVIEARVDAGHETAHSEQLDNEVVKILDALRSNGYEPTLRIENIEYHGGGGPLPAWTPAQPDGT